MTPNLELFNLFSCCSFLWNSLPVASDNDSSIWSWWTQVKWTWSGRVRAIRFRLGRFHQHPASQGLVTNFQLERVLTGERLGFFYGRYKVLYMIGAGTFARVYRAVHRDTGRVVAVKVLRRRHRDDPRQVEQFLREVEWALNCDIRTSYPSTRSRTILALHI